MAMSQERPKVLRAKIKKKTKEGRRPPTVHGTSTRTGYGGPESPKSKRLKRGGDRPTVRELGMEACCLLRVGGVRPYVREKKHLKIQTLDYYYYS
eukprot:scaffold182833_cov41-Tisochrysis_lutea.AAC.1